MMPRLFLFLLLLLAACGAASRQADANPEVVLSVAGEARAPGDSLTLVLENHAGSAVGYNLCSSTLERRTGAEWVAVPTDRVCTMELRILEPGAEATFPHTLPADIGPGEYRYRTGVEVPVGGSWREVASEPFRLP